MAINSYPVRVLKDENGNFKLDRAIAIRDAGGAAATNMATTQLECGATGLGVEWLSIGGDDIRCNYKEPGSRVDPGEGMETQRVRLKEGKTINILQADYLEYVDHCNACCVTT